MTAVPELKKPLNKWCEHCISGKGCRIYETRPPSCQNFQCLWYANPDLPEGLRPDICRVMFEAIPNKIVIALIPPHYPNAWREKPVSHFITRLLREGCAVAVSVDGGKERHLVLPKGGNAEDVMVKIQEYAKQVGVLKNGGTELHDRPDNDQPSG